VNRRSTGAHTARRAFTLVEAMAVVVIVGILASLALVGYRRYVTSAKTGEAVQMLGSIKSAQEAFKSETFRYMDVSDSLEGVYPQGGLSDVGTSSYAWQGGTPATAEQNFDTLGVTASSPVRYGYDCVAGPSAEEIPNLPSYAATETPDWHAPGGWWSVAVAVGDLDGDGSHAVFATSSLTAAIFSHQETEEPKASPPAKVTAQAEGHLLVLETRSVKEGWPDKPVALSAASSPHRLGFEAKRP